jgi:hypothetical protein
MGDIVIAVGICVLTAAMGYMGVHLTLHPVTTGPERRVWTGLFIVVTIGACLLIAWQTKRGIGTQKALEAELADLPNKFPKVPKPPTAQENAQALLVLEDQRKPKEVPKAPYKRVSIPVTPPPVSTPSPQVAQLTTTQSPDISDRPDIPYKTKVVVQSSTDFPSLRLAVECDGPLSEGRGGFTGIMLMTNQGIMNGHPNVFVITYQSATPPFGPSNPMILSFWSKEPIHCTKAFTF